ncbi:MAG: ABC transporter ATP-binding protein [Candidatus Bathyarchaeota archaeon]|nr:ABC transporter ATP-binding protein [Candidatus Bathyarchaeota archaeon]
MEPMLTVEDLRVYYKSIYGDVKSVDGVSFSVNPQEVFGIAGESGCGKSTLVEGVLRVIVPPGYIKSGKILFKNTDLLSLNDEELRRLRWGDLSYIPQGSMNSLNPVLRVEEQMIDAITSHTDTPKEEAREMSIARLKEVGLPVEVARMYPHELSGGMKQRVIIGTAILLKPSLVVADEPVTALDVVVQRGVLQSIANLRDNYGITVIFVAHDLAAHAEIVDRLVIMYAGEIAEIGSVYDVFEDPLHPYSKLLVAAIPSIEKDVVEGIPGLAPSPLNWPTGCRFHPRCPHVMPICSEEDPPLEEMKQGRHVACHLFR